MKYFWFGFTRGLTLPVYLFVGACDGVVWGWEKYREDTDELRRIKFGAPTESER